MRGPEVTARRGRRAHSTRPRKPVPRTNTRRANRDKCPQTHGTPILLRPQRAACERADACAPPSPRARACSLTDAPFSFDGRKRQGRPARTVAWAIHAGSHRSIDLELGFTGRLVRNPTTSPALEARPICRRPGENRERERELRVRRCEPSRRFLCRSTYRLRGGRIEDRKKRSRGWRRRRRRRVSARSSVSAGCRVQPDPKARPPTNVPEFRQR